MYDTQHGHANRLTLSFGAKEHSGISVLHTKMWQVAYGQTTRFFNHYLVTTRVNGIFDEITEI